jgi:DegV family protein with EDD domain
MSKIVIVTDSTAAFPFDTVGEVPIYSVPLNVIWGDENLKDGIDITVEQFYERLKGAKVMPSTSQPSPKEFLDMFQPLLNDGFEFFCMLISDKLSGTVNSAVQAKSMLGDVPVTVFDTESASLGMDLQINVVAKAINDGATLDELLPIAESARARTKVYFTVETLEFLIRGGRLSFVQGAAGTLLQIRPLLTLEEGKIVSMSKTRTFKKAVTALVDQVISDVEGKTLENIAGAYTNNEDFVHKTMHRVCDEIGVPMPDENLMMPLSPVIGTHTGPGAFGIAYMLGE